MPRFLKFLKSLNRAGLRLRFRGSAAPALAPAPLLHSIGGGGAWDEIIAFGLIIAFLVALAGFGYYTGRQKNKRRSRRRRGRSAKH